MAEGQLAFFDDTTEYDSFLDKFTHKKTSDDCYTPQNIYEAVADWVAREYGLNRENFVRPFWPGGNYVTFDYSENCVVVDNPPFSIRSDIVEFYQNRSIPFFLFSPGLTNFMKRMDITYVCTGNSIIYENGATISTGFVTNLDACLLRSAPDLYRVIDREDKKNLRQQKKQVAKLQWPVEVCTAAMVNKLSKYGVDFSVQPENAMRIDMLDAMNTSKKSIFGGGVASEYIGRKKKSSRRTRSRRTRSRRTRSRRTITVI